MRLDRGDVGGVGGEETWFVSEGIGGVRWNVQVGPMQSQM